MRGHLIVPGLLYGIAISFCFYVLHIQKVWYKILGFITVSCIAIYLSFYIYALLTPHVSNYSPFDNTLVQFCMAGMAGALSLAIGIKFLLAPLNYIHLSLLTIFGGLLVIFCNLIPAENKWGLLYFVWQTGMALAFGICIKFNEGKTVIGKI